MRKLIKIVALLLVVLVIVAIAVPFLIPLDTYKKEIIAQVKSATGRDLEIAGEIKASLFPVLGVDLERASLSNPDGYSTKQMLQVDKLTLEVDLTALLRKEIQIKRFILVKPVINLETNSAGKPNWDFAPAVAQAQEADQPVAKANPEASAAMVGGLMLGQLKVSDGEIYYRDGQTKKTVALTQLSLDASLAGLSEPFSAEGSALWNKEKVAIDIGLTDPSAFIANKPSAFKLSVSSSPITISYEGKATQTGANGNAAIAIASIPQLAQWTGAPFDWKGKAPLAFNAKGGLECTTTVCTLSNADITLDDIQAKGHLRVMTDTKVPTVEANLSTGMLDVNPYLPAKQASNSWFISPAYAKEWSSQRIDLSGLRAADAKIGLTAEGIVYDKITLGKTVINANLSGGTLKLSIPEAALYGGMAKVSATLDAGGMLSKDFSLENVKAEPFLKDAAGYDKLSGLFNMSASLNGRLTSEREFVNSLGGNGNVQLRDGALKGVDLASMVRNVKSAFKDVDTSQQKTDFSELSGTFAIAGGVISNNDLAMKAPLLRLKGEGTVNLPMDAINYRLTPEIVATTKGQGGKDKAGIEVPVLITGSLDNPRYAPDLEGMARKAIENPEAIKDTVKSVKEQLKEGKTDIKGLLKGLGGR